ncbi:hypothetical protein GQX74_015660 [Glossina fuscipes]|nr:hypothetical protein GQX74_015660 [Glossina fuscipes]
MRMTKQQQYQQQQQQKRLRIITTSSMPYSVAIVDNHLAINALNNGRSVGHKTMEAQYVCVHITQLYLQNHDSHTVPANKCGVYTYTYTTHIHINTHTYYSLFIHR